MFIVSSVMPMTIGQDTKTTEVDVELEETLDKLRFLCKTPYGFSEEKYEYYKEQLLSQYSSENSVICGYVNDVETGDPLEGARVDLDWEGNINWNTTYTDASGFYSMNVAAGELELDVHLDGYLTEFSDNYNIGEYETLWLNFSMYPMPPINSYIQGFVTDTEIGEPIVNVLVEVIWHDEYGHNLWFYDYTDDTGYYNIHTVAGEIRINAWADSYYKFISDWFFIEENEHLWFNFSMEPYNYPPYTPTINGPTTGKPGKYYEYTFVAIDPEDDDVYYDIYWGGPAYYEGLGPYASGEEVKINLSWFKQGTYYIRARAVDEHGNEGGWSFLEVTMPRNKVASYSLFHWFLERYPLLERLLSLTRMM